MEEARVVHMKERVVAVLPIFEPITAAWYRAYWLQELVGEDCRPYTMALLEAEMSVEFLQQSLELELFLVEAHNHLGEQLHIMVAVIVPQDL